MLKYLAFFRSTGNHFSNFLDQVLYRISIYLIPIVIGVISLVAVGSWEAENADTAGKRVDFHVIEAPLSVDSAVAAPALLNTQPYVRYRDTRLSEMPFWIGFVSQAARPDAAAVMEFPSRHAQEIACFDAQTLRLLGKGNRARAEGSLSAVKAGFALTLASAAEPRAVLCRMHFSGPARIEILQWSAPQLQLSSQQFHRRSGLLDGGMIVLTLFVLIAALINRESAYVLFAAWLAINLRVAALSAGWDFQWLGHSVPQEWLLRMRMLTIAAYYMLTLTLFRTLFREQLAKVGYAVAMRAAQLSCAPLLIFAAILPYKIFLPIIWIPATLGTALLVFFICRILLLARTPTAIWYSASIGVTLFSSFYEVVSAALGIKGMIGSVNFVTAALSSSLLAALAIAEQMRVEHKQRLEAQTELMHTFEAMPIGLFTLDADGRFLSANPALIAMLGRDVMADGQNFWEKHFKEGAWKMMRDMARNKTGGDLEIQGNEMGNGDAAKRFLVKAALARDKIEGSLQDVTEKYKAIEHLRFLADNDSLTKVLNRRGIETVLKAAMSRLTEGDTLALAYLDLDRFKLINDMFGHAAGDEVLKQVCQRVTALLNSDQYFGRIGGDEFIIVLPDVTIAAASRICRNIVASVGTESYLVGEKAFQVRGSIGLIEVAAGTQIKEAVSTADRACRDAKSGHNDNLVVYERNATAFRDLGAELDLVERLSTGAATDGLFVLMQPIMSLTAPYASLNFEVLLRMRDRDGSIIPASRIIAAGEASGRMGAIDRWVLSSTLAWLDSHYAQLANTQFVCMNLSGTSLNDEKFIQDVCSILGQNIHNAGRLCIEITEGVALRDLDNTHRFIDRVRSFGAKVALDDFGAGYTSFSYLKDLPADLLKIDGSFIVNMNRHPANVAIVEAIVNLARNLGMKTIAEWAEDIGTVQVLAELGVDYVQGDVVASPQCPDVLLRTVSSASLIQDEQLIRFLRALTPASNFIAQLELLDAVGFKGSSTH